MLRQRRYRKLLRNIFLSLQQFESIDHFKQEIEVYIHYYNHLRIKSRLRRKSPVTYRTSFGHAA
ncbi:IS3 family transposase [Peribacillus muralis]|uniref:IS3 family transposase n=1 Tax=Peribacillus muralis TaxID=264697 RepID=UPI00367257D6